MMKLLDYYYRVLIRLYSEELSHRVIAVMSITLMTNLLSLGFLFVEPYVEWYYVFWACAIICAVYHIALIIVYSSKRRERIQKEYEYECKDSRQRGTFWVIAYEILSLVIVISVIALTLKPDS
jgi:hypothetical protein